MENNHTLVSQGFRSLVKGLAPYIARELATVHGQDWWNKGVLYVLKDNQKRNLPASGEPSTLIDALDIQCCLLLFDLQWNDIFKKKLSIDNRNWAKELIGVRNKLAHLGGNDFSDDDTWRALDTQARLCEQIDAEKAEEIRKILRTSRYGSADGSTAVVAANAAMPVNGKSAKTAGVLAQTPEAGLPCWRDVMEPHPDVAQGRYKNAEFAADLAQVARGEGSYEYRDPVEFFARTYVTEGMSGLLVQALKRINGKDGEPVIQLKTAFGGGKTHSMLALYHIMRGKVSAGNLPNIKSVITAAGISSASSMPKANVAVLVGTAIDPTKSKRPINMPGITINTLWGEMAAQLAESAGNPKLYDFVKEADKKGVSPGSEALKNLFDACAPCLVLMDELVAYAKKIYGVNGLPAGSFDNFISFIQEITEAARASKNSLVVASIPESDIEIGGEAGKTALETIEHTFGRMESIWKPVAASEGFEVVRRRLFLDCKNPEGREQVCSKFSRMYADNTADFPLETKELEYKQRMLSCYPIHPEIFDRLYEDWATLERFQRTRGVLRLMAAVIHELWMRNDAGLMIMPGSVPLDVPNVRDELTRHLSEGWNGIVDVEVDGKRSRPYQLDESNQRYGKKLAARRVSRTIMLGSAPTGNTSAVRGIESSRIRLGVVQPGEIIADFNDALNTLQTTLSFLYTNPSVDRFWYDTHPTLRKTVADRATQIPAPDVEYEIEQRLSKLRKELPFVGVHICPASSLDVSDEQASRLVVLRTTDEYKASDEQNHAIQSATDILNNRGTNPRKYRNMLAFVAPDHDMMNSLKQEVRRYLAWKSIKDDSEDLNLDAAQNKETANNLQRSDDTVKLRIKEAYCWLLVPYIDRSTDMKTVVWDQIRISGGNEEIITKAAKKMMQNEALITKWAPALLLMELNNLLWKDKEHIQIKQLWEYLCTYCYLPRLSNFEVLADAVRTGLNSTEYFALAAGISENRYIDLKYNQFVGNVNQSDYLLKTDAAKKQIAEEQAKQQAITEATSTALSGTTSSGKPYTSPDPATTTTVAEPPHKDTHFYMTAPLDNTRIGRDVQKLVEEVVSHLVSVDGCLVKISIEVDATSAEGFTQPTIRCVSENCRTLKINEFGFE